RRGADRVQGPRTGRCLRAGGWQQDHPVARHPDAPAARGGEMMKVFKFLNGLPGVVLACLAALGAFQAYVHMRERLAVERAAWTYQRDSLRAVIAAEQLAAETRDRQRADSIAHLTARIR